MQVAFPVQTIELGGGEMQLMDVVVQYTLHVVMLFESAICSSQIDQMALALYSSLLDLQ